MTPPPDEVAEALDGLKLEAQSYIDRFPEFDNVELKEEIAWALVEFFAPEIIKARTALTAPERTSKKSIECPNCQSEIITD